MTVVDVNMIVAMCGKTRGIGLRGNLPDWSLKSDLRHFRRLTEGGIVVMGKNTYLSICRRLGKGLPKRLNIVVSSSLGEVDGAVVVSSMNELVMYLSNEAKQRPVWIIGGEQIYRQCMEDKRIHVCNYYITRIFRNGESVDEGFECDTFFPMLNERDDDRRMNKVLLNTYEENGMYVKNWRYYYV